MGRILVAPLRLSRCAKVTAITTAIVRATSYVFKETATSPFLDVMTRNMRRLGTIIAYRPRFIEAVHYARSDTLSSCEKLKDREIRHQYFFFYTRKHLIQCNSYKSIKKPTSHVVLVAPLGIVVVFSRSGHFHRGKLFANRRFVRFHSRKRFWRWSRKQKLLRQLFFILFLALLLVCSR